MRYDQEVLFLERRDIPAQWLISTQVPAAAVARQLGSRGQAPPLVEHGLVSRKHGAAVVPRFRVASSTRAEEDTHVPYFFASAGLMRAGARTRRPAGSGLRVNQRFEATFTSSLSDTFRHYFLNTRRGTALSLRVVHF